MKKSKIITSLTVVSLILVTLLTVIALLQPPYPDPQKKKSLLENTIYPLEINPEQRLLYSNAFFHDVFFLTDSKSGWAAGDEGAIFSTIDGGKNWKLQNSWTKVPLYSITFHNEQIGWAAGADGVILSTVDGGKNWKLQNSGTEAGLNSITFHDEQIGWAAGDYSVILTTVDGGKNWKTQNSGTEAWLFSITFHDEQIGWATGFDGVILATVDGGKNWKTQNSGTEAWLYSITFHDEQIGWAAGDDGVILATVDGGKNWKTQNSGTEAGLNSITFHDEQIGWAAGNDGVILVTVDGGKNWKTQNRGNKAWLYSIIFHDEQIGWATGNYGEILTTVDGGKNWKPQTSGTKATLFSITFHDEQLGWAAALNGEILFTIDGGKSWRSQAKWTTDNLSSITFHDEQLGWASGSRGVILSTVDGGKNWKTQNSGTTARLYSITFHDEQIGWAAGYEGLILSTADGGESWEPQNSGTGASLLSITFHDELVGWAAGQDGIILSTADGGKSWEPQTSGTKATLFSITFHDEQIGWAAGDDGIILVTVDGGKNWKTQNSGTKAWLYSITFHDEQIGWAAGYDGLILSTVNGGKSWEPQNSGTTAPLNSITFHDEQIGWAAGNDGVILATVDGGKSWDIYKDDRFYIKLPAIWYYTVISLILLILIIATITLSEWQINKVHRIEEVAESDAHLNNFKDDCLGFTSVAEGISRFIRNENTIPPLTIAVEGAWGTGKSSLMSLVKRDLINHGHSPVWFNAWHHENEKSLLAALLENIKLQAIPSILTLEGISFRIKLGWQRLKRFFLLFIAITLVYLFSFVVIMTDQGFIKPEGLVEHFPWLVAICNSAVLFSTLSRTFKPFAKHFNGVIKNIRGIFTIRDFEKDTGFRYKFRREFGEVTRALSPKNLVVIIDDLDRCGPDNVASLLESINFLVSSGNCFVIMGIERSKVEVCVGLAFEKVAEAVIDDQEIKKEEKKIVEYARDYLEKLINIEIAVPLPEENSDYYKELLRSGIAEANSTEEDPSKKVKNSIIDSLMGPVLLWFYRKKRVLACIPITIILLAIASFSVYYAGTWARDLISTYVKQKKDDKNIKGNIEDSTNDKIVSDEIRKKTDETEKSNSPQPPESNRDSINNVIIRPAKSDRIHYEFLLLLLLFPIPLLVWLLRPRSEEIKDSPEFIKTFKLWENLLLEKLHTPRAIKRFKNKVRFYAMRFHKRPDDTSRLERYLIRIKAIKKKEYQIIDFPELFLITLAVLYEYNPQLITDDNQWNELKKLLNDTNAMETNIIPPGYRKLVIKVTDERQKKDKDFKGEITDKMRNAFLLLV